MHRILSVGQCGYDHRRLSTQISRDFGSQVVPAETFDEAIDALRGGGFHLVLVNRVTDADGSLGVDLIRSLKGDPDLSRLPIMLVSDLPNAQREAEALGALPGFGKRDLGSLSAVEKLAPVLGSEPVE